MSHMPRWKSTCMRRETALTEMRGGYNKEAPLEARERTLHFFKKHLA
jgi:hypothetical protein